MARNGSGVYSLPNGSLAVDGTTIEIETHNTPIQDLADDANTARPIVAGGTGATTVSGARSGLGVPGLSADETISGDWTFSGDPVFSGSPDLSGVSNASTIRSDLGLEIGADVQAFNAYLADVAGLTLAEGDVLYFDGTDIVKLGVGTAGQVLTVNSGATAPEWTDPASPAGTIVAWCVFDGTGTPSITYGSGIASITDTATGLYALTFTTERASAEYAVVASATNSGGNSLKVAAKNLTTTGFDILMGNGTFAQQDGFGHVIVVE